MSTPIRRSAVDSILLRNNIFKPASVILDLADEIAEKVLVKEYDVSGFNKVLK